jgi:transposase
MAFQRSRRSGLAGDLCWDAAHEAVLKAQINKTDRNDARGIAQMMRAGLYRPVHVKTLRSQKLRMLLTHRKPLQSKAIAIENDLRDREVPSLKAHAKEIKKPAPALRYFRLPDGYGSSWLLRTLR